MPTTDHTRPPSTRGRPRVQALILAAGMGTRLGRTPPKPLTRLADGRTILHQQLDGLRSAVGPDLDVTVVVGYKAEQIIEAAPKLTHLHNADYHRTNTAKSLLLGLAMSRPGGVLWLNGDVVFDPVILRLAEPTLRADQSFVCVDTADTADEEVKYTVDTEGFIQDLSKTVVGGLGEAVGINYVSAADKPALIRELGRCADTDYFERGIETAIATHGTRFRPVHIPPSSAVEVDFEEDLRRANLQFVAAGPPARPVPGSVPPGAGNAVAQHG